MTADGGPEITPPTQGHVQRALSSITAGGMEAELVVVEAPVEVVDDGEGEGMEWELVDGGGEAVIALEEAATEQVAAHVDEGVATHEHDQEEEIYEIPREVREKLDEMIGRFVDAQGEEDRGEEDMSGGSATAEIDMAIDEEYSDESHEKPSCAEDLKIAYDELCARNAQRMQKAKEFNADLNAKARLTLGEWKPKLIQAYTEAASTAVEWSAAIQEQAKHLAGNIEEIVANTININENTITDHTTLTVLTPAVMAAALLVAVLSWLACSAGGADVAPHNHVHMETLSLLEKEMGRLDKDSYRHGRHHTHVTHVTQASTAPSVIVNKKNQTNSKKNRTRGHYHSARAKAHRVQKFRNKEPSRPRVCMPPPANETYNESGQTPHWPQIIFSTPTSNQETAVVHKAGGWIAMDQRMSEAIAHHAPLRIAGIYNSIGEWPSVGYRETARAGWVQSRDEQLEDILHAVDGWAMQATEPVFSDNNTRWSIALPPASSSSTALALTTQRDIGCDVYATSESNQLVLLRDFNLHEPLPAQLNLSMLALGDGTLWPTIPLPPSPTIRPPISMPPVAMSMPPVDSAISMPPVAISLGSSEPDFKIMSDALITNALVLLSDFKLHADQLHKPLPAQLNLSMLALGDGTLWPTIPLPPSPTIRPPISMPPVAVSMPPVDSAISMPPVAISLGSSEDFKIMSDALITNQLSVRPAPNVPYNHSLLNLAWPSLDDAKNSGVSGKTKRKTVCKTSHTFNSTPISTVPPCANWTKMILSNSAALRSKQMETLQLNMPRQASARFRPLLYDSLGLQVHNYSYTKGWSWNTAF